MSEFARLEDKLAKLRQRERAPGEVRRLKGADVGALIAAIVGEIDETILPRRLIFSWENNAVHLAVANRRLQALLSPAPDGMDDALVDKELPDGEDPMITSLGAELRAVLDGVDSLTISSQRPKSMFASDVGVPVAQLSRVWGISSSETVAADPSQVLGEFLASVTDEVIAWLRIEGEEVTDQAGDEEKVTELGEKAAVFLDGYFSQFESAFPEPSDACATVLSPSSDQPAALFFIEYGELSALIAVSPGKVLSLATRWQQLVAE